MADPRPTAEPGSALDEAVAAVNATFDDLEAALEAGDVDAVVDVVSRRGEAIDRLAAASQGTALPEPVRTSLAAREQAIQERMSELDSRMRERLHEGSRRAHAARRYARS